MPIPGVDSKHLKVKQKLVIPAPAKAADVTPAMLAAAVAV